MKKILVFIFLFFPGIYSAIYAQGVVELKEFSPFVWKHDTLFFNQQGYEWVKVPGPEVNGIYTTTAYKLTRLEFFEHRISDQLSSAKLFEPYKPVYSSDLWSFYQTYEWYHKKTPPSKTIFLKKKSLPKRVKDDIGFYLKETSLLPPMLKKDTTVESYPLPAHLFSLLDEVMKDFILLLHFENRAEYRMGIFCKDTVRATMSDFAVCNPVNFSNQKVLNSTEIQDTLAALLKKRGVPVFMIENKPFYYSVEWKFDFQTYIIEKTWREKMAGSPLSVKVFPGQQHLLALRDSFNNATIFYLPQGIQRNQPAYIHKERGLWSFDKKMVDINNDGRTDLVIDSTVIDRGAEGHNIISYIPDYPDTSFYLPDIEEKLIYDKELGNKFYYVRESGVQERIFTFVKGEQKNIISIEKRYNWSLYGYRRLSHFNFYVGNNPALCITMPFNGKKTTLMVDKVHQLITDYLEHPEKLPVDFPMK